MPTTPKSRQRIVARLRPLASISVSRGLYDALAVAVWLALLAKKSRKVWA